ncbi:granulocyte colony-stimulating factor receptor [Discoglossus pictus]
MQRDRGILLGEVLLFFFLPGTHSCGTIAVESPIIQFGAPLTASCTLQQELCRGLEEEAVGLLWKLDGNIIPKSHYRSVQGNSSTVYFSNFNKSSGILSCYIKSVKGLYLVNNVQINAGYPPSPPSNLSCLMNLTDEGLVCSWQPGRDPLIKTSAILLYSRSKGQCNISPENKTTCIPQEGQSSCTISRIHFNPTQKIVLWVTMQNALGSVDSTPLCLFPNNAVKLDPPIIERLDSLHSRPGCVSIEWRMAKLGTWIEQWYQLRYRREWEINWTESQELIDGSLKNVLCGLSPASKYHFQLRCIKSHLRGYWSEWGTESSLITAEEAPKEMLITWWRKLQATEQVQLLWKAPQLKEVRRQTSYASPLWYIVKISPGHHNSDIAVCNTTALNCSFSLPSGTGKASIWAYNTAGSSPETELLFYDRNGPPASGIQVSPDSDQGLRVEWEQQVSAKGYILEWCKYSPSPDCEVNWKTELAGSRLSILRDNIKPLQMYTVWLYPLYENTVGSSVQINAYSRQGAPALSPKLQLTSYSKSQAALSWEPIPVEKRNGFITNYTVFWIYKNEKEQAATLNGSATSFVIRNLQPFSMYKVFLMSSTAGGSVNGTIMVLHTPLMDELETVMLVLSITCILFITAMLCLCKHGRINKQLWPIVPDPANSSMGKWSPMLKEGAKVALNTSQDINQLITSDLIIVEAEEKNLQKHSSNFKQSYLESHSLQSPSTAQGLATLQSYVNIIDSVQYAQVITGGYRQQSPPASMYVRSDSTQPLLGDMSPSPQNYENMWFHSKQEDSVFLVEEETLTDFPLLQGLKIHGEGEAFSL